MEKKPLIIGNWKMNKTMEESISFINNLSPLIMDITNKIYLAIPFTSIAAAKKNSENTKIVIGAQNMNDAIYGAYTGEISSLMLKDAGAEFVILGHSERRILFGENDYFINKKLIRALKDEIEPVLCIGETLEQKEAEETEKIIEEQLTKDLKGISLEAIKNLIIAYEPIWAIGSGKAATSEMAQKIHEFIRRIMSKLYDKTIANSLYVLYGGSVKEDNVKDFLSQKDIDGVLVGGASLKIESFVKIIKNI